MPTDQMHVIAFLVTLGVIGLLGVLAFAYIWISTSKPHTEPGKLDLPQQPSKEISREPKAPPLAR